MHRLDERPDVGPEAPLHVLEPQKRVLDRVVQQPGDDRVPVHRQVRQQYRHRDGVADEGLAAPPVLARVRAVGHDQRVPHDRALVLREVRDGLFQPLPVPVDGAHVRARHGVLVPLAPGRVRPAVELLDARRAPRRLHLRPVVQQLLALVQRPDRLPQPAGPRPLGPRLGRASDLAPHAARVLAGRRVGARRGQEQYQSDRRSGERCTSSLCT
jgi:hypothetical protein